MKPPIIFDNIIYSLQKAGGISAFWSQLTSRVAASGEFDCHYVEYPGAEENIFRKELDIPESNVIRGKHLPLGLERLLEPWLPPSLLRRQFVFHSSYYRVFSNPLARNVITFHDLTHELGGDGNIITRPLMRMLHARAIRNSEETVCVSLNTLNDIKQLFPKLADKRMSVAYNAPVVAEHIGRIDIAGEYLLFMGARDPYKHFDTAVLLAAASERELKVVGAPFTRAEEKMIRKCRAKVSLHPYADGAASARLYAGAFGLVYLSEYEGFGIPVAEAQSYGCPVITLRRSALPEIAGEGAIYLDRPDIQEALAALEKLRDKNFRSLLTELGSINVRRFDWDKTAEHYLFIYRRLLAEKSRQR